MTMEAIKVESKNITLQKNMAYFYPNLPIKSLLHQNMQTNFSPFLYQGEATKVILMFLAVADLCQLLSDFITFEIGRASCRERV